MLKKKVRILVSPLDWGMGHSTRCIPVIRQLLLQDVEVVLAADGMPATFLQSVFPQLEMIRLPGFRIRYPKSKMMIPGLAVQIPGLLWSIYREHRLIQRIIRQHGIDAVISDNRFGLWSGQTYSVYITHQLMIKAPAGMHWIEPLLRRIHRWFINHYDECWVPDLPGSPNLSGDLAHQHPLPGNGSFIGPLSRFEPITTNHQIHSATGSPKLLAILSGPEPQRTAFENILLTSLVKHGVDDAVVLRGLPGAPPVTPPNENIRIFSHLPDDEFRRMVLSAGTIVCRSGYSTLMDLFALKRTAFLVPTPGQTEQEYLAAYHQSEGLFRGSSQESFNLAEVLATGADSRPKAGLFSSADLLGVTVRRFVEGLGKK